MNKKVTQLRWPERLRKAVMESAKESNRSMNAEIISRLEESFRKPSAPAQERAA